MLVFRDGRRELAVRPLFQQLEAACARACSGRPPEREATLDALLRAGELECGLADADSPAARATEKLTEALAEILVDAPHPGEQDRLGWGTRANQALAALRALRARELPEKVSLSVPEGFAHYALHPLDYAEAVARLPVRERAVVVGIRSIGTTLSAVACAALRRRGKQARRLTVRPTGHPWERVVAFSSDAQRVLREESAKEAEFLVVDEGPGLSGSSFLATAEALEALGVARERVTLIGSHAAEASRLCARDAAARWGRFRFVAVAPPARVPEGPAWHGLGEHASYSGSWRQFERRKILSSDGTLFKFEGLGPYSEAPIARARALAEAGFAPQVTMSANGFAAYEFVDGRPMRAAQLDGEVLRRLAEYCAARAEMFPAEGVDTAALAEMVAVNSREGAGGELRAELALEHPVIADGKMQPHEWVRASDGRMLKTDAASHGDDHFFPGRTDIAWDLAGAMVEWQMDAAQETEFLAEYRRLSGDDARPRIGAWRVAYTLFRLGYSQMAAEATGDERMTSEAERYRALLLPARLSIVAA